MRNGSPPQRRQLLIQIDGLSKHILDTALARGAMPAVARYLSRPGVVLLPFYSGLPSTTPAVQGELFYGVPCAVPAFAFLEQRRIARHMLEPAAADQVQQRLEQEDPGLLAGGSSYCNIYTGGAAVWRFCPAGLARRPASAGRRQGPLAHLRSAAAYAGVAFRSLIMLLGEILRFLLQRRHTRATPLRTRLRDSWNRIIVSVAIRDSARLAALRDLRAGLPVVHINFLGYDKQAHRYGPEAPPAMRALKGIDRAVASLLDEIRGDEQMTAIIYSDHGQEPTVTLSRSAGKTLDRIVQKAAAALPTEPDPEMSPESNPGPVHQRSATPAHAEAQSDTGEPRQPASDAHEPRVSRTALEKVAEQVLGVGVSPPAAGVTTVQSGPIAHIYLDEAARRHRTALAHGIAAAAPGVAVIVSGPTLTACYGNDEPVPLAELCGARLADHPFREHIERDLAALARHPCAGDLIAVGTGFGDRPLTFADENGAHGGPGPRETEAFVIAPDRLGLDRDAPPRILDLREALLRDRNAHAH